MGSFSPNNFGLYDMHGNVSEWTCSGYNKTYGAYDSEQHCVSRDPGGNYAMRGGHFYSHANNVRSAYRIPNGPGPAHDYLMNPNGFRLARGPKK